MLKIKFTHCFYKGLWFALRKGMKISTKNAEITRDDVIRRHRNVISKIKFLFLHFLEFLDRCLVLMVLIFHFWVNFVTLSIELLVDLNYSFHKVNMKVEKSCETNELYPVLYFKHSVEFETKIYRISYYQSNLWIIGYDHCQSSHDQMILAAEYFGIIINI